MITNFKRKVAAASVMVLALLMVPAPLLPPHRLAEAVQWMLGVSWKVAYLVAAAGLQVAFYGSIGLLMALTVNRAPTLRRRLLQIMLAPLVVIGVAMAIRSVKLAHVPMLVNAVIPAAACLLGIGLGLGLLYRGWKVTLFLALVVIGAALWVFLDGASAELSRATEAHLRRIVAAGPSLPTGDARFGGLLQTVFAPLPANAQGKGLQRNRAAIIALGIVIGHERLARFVGLDANGELVCGAIVLRQGTTLRGREDWARHYALSAALAVLEHPLVSDAAGLMKEELDALTHGSGFSFGDLAADRAGVRFAGAATHSEVDEQAMYARLHRGFAVDDFYPQTVDLPENLTVEQFRTIYGGVGSQRYRQVVTDIEARLDRCAALSPRHRP
jgi:hypothetical protein